MDEFRFQIEWLEAGDVRGAELRATWCRLDVTVNEFHLFHLYDQPVKTVRNALYLPAYVIAEWFVDRWFFLTQEFSRKDIEYPNYEYRHDLIRDREGYLLPAIQFFPVTDAEIGIRVKPMVYEYEKKSFISDDFHTCSISSFEAGLRAFIDAVVQRLEDCEIEDTYLADRWEEICTFDVDERAYARATAALGKHYAELTEEEERRFLEHSEGIPQNIAMLLSKHLTFDQYVDTIRNLVSVIDKLKDEAETFEHLFDWRTALKEKIGPSPVPWRRGYDMARHLRALVGRETDVFRSLEDIDETLKLHSSNRWISSDIGNLRAIVYFSEEHKCKFALADSARPASQMFAYCRALGEFFSTGSRQLSVVSTVDAWSQRMNRAFAAEFLVPAATLRSMIGSRSIRSSELASVADTLGVSILLIAHQIENQTDITILEDE